MRGEALAMLRGGSSPARRAGARVKDLEELRGILAGIRNPGTLSKRGDGRERRRGTEDTKKERRAPGKKSTLPNTREQSSRYEV